jgi:hypothetical protein
MNHRYLDRSQRRNLQNRRMPPFKRLLSFFREWEFMRSALFATRGNGTFLIETMEAFYTSPIPSHPVERR